MSNDKAINEFITKVINGIIARYALHQQKDTVQFNENALYVLWLMREHIHRIEKNLLQSDNASFNNNDSIQLKRIFPYHF